MRNYIVCTWCYVHVEQHANNPQFAGVGYYKSFGCERTLHFIFSLSFALTCMCTHTQMMHSSIVISLLVSSLGTAVFAQCQGGREGKLVLHRIVYLVNPAIRFSVEARKASRIPLVGLYLSGLLLSLVCITAWTN